MKDEQKSFAISLVASVLLKIISRSHCSEAKGRKGEEKFANFLVFMFLCPSFDFNKLCMCRAKGRRKVLISFENYGSSGQPLKSFHGAASLSRGGSTSFYFTVVLA